jgi:hypothetical protein
MFSILDVQNFEIQVPKGSNLREFFEIMLFSTRFHDFLRKLSGYLKNGASKPPGSLQSGDVALHQWRRVTPARSVHSCISFMVSNIDCDDSIADGNKYFHTQSSVYPCIVTCLVEEKVFKNEQFQPQSTTSAQQAIHRFNKFPD